MEKNPTLATMSEAKMIAVWLNGQNSLGYVVGGGVRTVTSNPRDSGIFDMDDPQLWGGFAPIASGDPETTPQYLMFRFENGAEICVGYVRRHLEQYKEPNALGKVIANVENPQQGWPPKRG